MFVNSSSRVVKSLIMILMAGLLSGPFLPAVAQTPEASPAASPIASAAETTPVFEEAECMYELPPGLTEDDVVCGWVTAPMYPDGSQPGTVTLPIIRVLAATDNPAPEPLMILLGGPGQDMSAVLPLFGSEAPLWSFMRERQDVILFDQRGMGQSTPSLACSFEQSGEDGAPESDTNIGFALLRCGTELQTGGIDPTAFTTESNAADIEAIRIAMGYEQVDLYGISYGSKLALSAIRDYPDSIRSTIISSPLPLEQNPFADQTTGFDQALKTIWDTCAADEACAEANPDPEGDFIAAVERLKTEPMTIVAENPATGESMELVVDNYQFMQILYLGVFVGPLVPMVPYLVTSVANGDDSILQMVGPTLLTGGGLSMGALFTYFCQDEVPFSSAQDTETALGEAALATPFTDGSWIGLGDQTYTVCNMWSFPAADEIEAEAVESDEPLLILTGEFDPITPAINGEHVASNFPNSQLVNFKSQGHDPATYVPECSSPIITGFLDDPTAPVDAECANEPVDFAMTDMSATPAATPLVDPAAGSD